MVHQNTIMEMHGVSTLRAWLSHEGILSLEFTEFLRKTQATRRSSQAGYRQFYESEVPPRVTKVAVELLSCNGTLNYDALRLHAGSSLRKMLKCFPPLHFAASYKK